MTPPSETPKLSFVITLGLLTGVAAVTVDISLPAVPAMVDALETNLSRTQQIVGVFMAGMGCGQIPAGLMSDRMGRLPVLYFGMGLFALFAVVAAMANSIELILAARFVQGFGAAAAIVLSRAIVRDIASGQEAAKLMSVMMMIFTLAPVIAPSIGAALVTQWGWRAPLIAIAVLGVAVLGLIRNNIPETREANTEQHPLRQLVASFSEFFSHRQSIFGLLMIILPTAGFMAVITVSAALVVEIYGYSITAFGLIFATAGLSILIGSALNRLLVSRFDGLQLIALGAALAGICGVQLLIMAWLNEAPFVWLWGCFCLFMFMVAILAPNATVLALDPLPRTAGVASSIIGTSQNIVGAAGALFGAVIYDGSIRNAVIILAVAGTLVAGMYLLRPIICPTIVHHRDELARS